MSRSSRLLQWKRNQKPPTTNPTPKTLEKDAINPWDTPPVCRCLWLRILENAQSKTTILPLIVPALAATNYKEQALVILKQAVEEAEKLENDFEREFALNFLAPALAKAGEPERAMELAKKIDDDGDKAGLLRDVGLSSSQVERANASHGSGSAD